MKVVAGVDLGATRIKLVGVSESGEVHDQSFVETNDDSLVVAEKIERWVTVIREYIEKLEQRISAPVEAVGIAAPGLVGSDGRAIENMPGRLEGLVGLDWAAILGLNRPIAVLNDAHSALLAEAWIGSASGHRGTSFSSPSEPGSVGRQWSTASCCMARWGGRPISGI